MLEEVELPIAEHSAIIPPFLPKILPYNLTLLYLYKNKKWEFIAIFYKQIFFTVIASAAKQSILSS